MRSFFLYFVLFYVAVDMTMAQLNCTQYPDGAHGYGCSSYTLCEGGKGTIVDCEPGHAFDQRVGQCEPWSTVPPPCGSIDNNCTARADARYAVEPDCLYYYTCVNQIFFGTNPCNEFSETGVAVDVTIAQISCVDLPDGAHGYGCSSYTLCEGGRGTIVDCEQGYAFNQVTGVCEPWSIVPPPCGSIDNNCTARADGRYAIVEFECLYYYTCVNEIFFGTNPCNEYSETEDYFLRFDFDLQLCNWVWDVPPPCGTNGTRVGLLN